MQLEEMKQMLDLEFYYSEEINKNRTKLEKLIKKIYEKSNENKCLEKETFENILEVIKITLEIEKFYQNLIEQNVQCLLKNIEFFDKGSIDKMLIERDKIIVIKTMMFILLKKHINDFLNKK